MQQRNIANHITSKVAFWLLGIMTVLYGLGCGASSPLQGKEDIGVDTNRMAVFNVQAVDGPIFGADVRLMSLTKGLLAFGTSDAQGRVSLQARATDIESLGDNEVLYFYTESRNGNTVQRRNGTFNTALAMQIRFKSYLPKGKVLKARLLLSTDITGDPEVNKAAVISHFSNAKAIMLESRLKRTGVLARTVDPNAAAVVAFTDNQLQQIHSDLNTVELAIGDGSTNISRKFKLLAMATKALVENNAAEFLTASQVNADVTKSEELLVELLENSTLEISQTFNQQLNVLTQEINADLASNTFSDSLGDNAVISMSQFDSNDVASTVKINVINEFENLTTGTTFITVDTDISKAPTYLMPGRVFPGEITFGFDLTTTHLRTEGTFACESNLCD